MAATQQDYARLALIMNGDVLVQMSNIKITWESGEQPIELLNEGLGGFTPGSGNVKIEGGFYIPIGGLEEDYVQKLVDREYVTFQVPIGRSDYVGKGKIQTCEISQSTNAAVEGSFSWLGELAALQ